MSKFCRKQLNFLSSKNQTKKRLGDKNRGLKVRKNCTYYLAALVVRAKFVKKFTLVKVFEFLLSFAEFLNRKNEPMLLPFGHFINFR